MKTALYLCLLLLLIGSCESPKREANAFHPIVLKAKETSFYTERVDWEKVNKQFIVLTKDQEDLKEGLQYLINSLDDKHACVRDRSNYQIVVSYTGEIEKQNSLERDLTFVNKVINDWGSQVKGLLLFHIVFPTRPPSPVTPTSTSV